jgi:hypothetical protein
LAARLEQLNRQESPAADLVSGSVRANLEGAV